MGALALILVLGVAGAPTPRSQAADSFERGVAAYRRGDYGEASTLWRACLDEDLAPGERARVAYDLGNAAWRGGDALEAVGWYTVALRDDPRNQDVWYNLELARAEAGLEPADRGDLRSTWNRLVTSVTPAESRLLVLLALVPLALALGFEAFLGGKLWRRLALAAAALVLVASIPWIDTHFQDEGDTVLVVRPTAVPLRAEPRRELEPIAQLDPGAEARRIDALPGWVRVRTSDGQRGWLQEDTVFALEP